MKTKRISKILSMLLTLTMVVGMQIPVSAQASVRTVGTGGDYSNLTEALAAAENGDTITLLNDITESVNYTTEPGKIITIDGQNHTITGIDGNGSVAMTICGSALIKLKNINIWGGTASAQDDNSFGLVVRDSATVQSEGTVKAKGGNAYIYTAGLGNYSSGSVNITEAKCGTATYGGITCGVKNFGAGTVNVRSCYGVNGGVINSGTGTVNVADATGFADSVVNSGTGTVNVDTATSTRRDTQDGIENRYGGKVNVRQNIGAALGVVNTNVSALVLNKGAGAECLLESIIVAATGDTNIGALPPVYQGNVQSQWYTDGAKQNLFNGTTVVGGTILYSTFCSMYTVSGKITGSDAPGGLAASLQLKDRNGNSMGNPVTAGANGTYTISVPEGKGYTIVVTMSGYVKASISAFDITGNVTGKDLTLSKAYNVSGTITGSDAPGGLAASLQLKNGSGNNLGNPVLAGADGTYTILDVPLGTGYTIAVTMNGYYDEIVPAFDISNSNVTANVSLKKIYTVSGKITASDAAGGIAASLQLKDSNQKNVGNPVKADADGTYTVNAPAGTGYTIKVSMPRYYTGEISGFTIAADVTGKNLTLQKAVPTVGTGGGYSSLSVALAEAGNGDTITLLNDITECVHYTTVTDTAVTIDGQNHTITGTDGNSSCALALSGSGTVKLKNLHLLGGAASSEDSNGMEASERVSVRCEGTVDTTGGNAARYSCGLVNGSANVVDITSATGGVATVGSYGVWNGLFATTNVNLAKGGSYGINVQNIGCVNAKIALGTVGGVYNSGSGQVNVTTSNGVYNDSYSIVNVANNTGSASGNTSGINANVASLTLSKEPGTDCVLDSITVAASGGTIIKNLPGVYRDGIAGTWYTDSAKSSKFVGSSVSGESTLYSGFPDETLVSIGNPPAITGVVNGTAKTASALGLPTVLNLVTAHGPVQANVSWTVSSASYDPSSSAKQSFTVPGVVTLPVGVMNPNGVPLAASISVTVDAATSGIVTFDLAGGTRTGGGALTQTVPLDAAAIAPTVSRTSYTFTGWDKSFSNVKGNMTVTAIWTSNSNNGNSTGGGGALPITPARPVITTETPATGTIAPSVTGTVATEAKSDSNGKATANMTASQVTDAVKKAVDSAAKKGQGTKAKLEIKVSVSGDAKSVETNIPSASFKEVTDSKIEGWKVSTPIADISFDHKALSAIAKGATGDVKISAAKVDTKTLSEESKQIVGARPVYSFSVNVGNTKVSEFGSSVTVSLPYTLGKNEEPNAIVVYYINSAGKLETMQGKYDSKSGTVTFETTHFSEYMIGYNKVPFQDVASTAWYDDAISFISARGIATGTSEGHFTPDGKLSRGQFLVMVMRAYGISADEGSKDNFSDAGATYYTGYLAAAKRLGITAGVGNNAFAPDMQITRQEMVTLLYNTLKPIGKLPASTSEKSLTAFHDANGIASWAKDAMGLFVRTGTISGSDGKLNPTDTTSRAELAQVLYQLMIR